MTNKTPRVAKNRRESTTPGTRKTGKLFFFLLLSSSSDGLAQRRINLSRWFTHETAAFYTEQCTSPSLFHNFEVSHQAAAATHSKTMASIDQLHGCPLNKQNKKFSYKNTNDLVMATPIDSRKSRQTRSGLVFGALRRAARTK